MDDEDDLEAQALWLGLEPGQLPPAAQLGPGGGWAAGPQAKGPAAPAAACVEYNGRKVHLPHFRHWLYPAGAHNPREYQFAMVRSALFANTLVCLPTGMGKTFIAAVVMLNFYRWFPEGKLVFLAPTRPLVEQQCSACREVMGLTEADVVLMSASMQAKRAEVWAAKRVFFCTPDILNNDLRTGKCPDASIVCVVVDECHRAVGDAPAAQALQQLHAARVPFRLLGLSATPGSSFDGVQEVIKKLHVAVVEYRSEQDPDVAPHCHEREVEVIGVPESEHYDRCQQLVSSLLYQLCAKLSNAKVFQAQAGLSGGQSSSKLGLMAARDGWREQDRAEQQASRQAALLAKEGQQQLPGAQSTTRARAEVKRVNCLFTQ
ncbi:helicase ATP-binding domain-containing protein, partial [Haematococcus lacustris]